MSQLFTGKVALVTGGGSGIGRAASRRLAAEGACVVVADIDEAGANATAKLIQSDGGKAISIKADISSEQDNAVMFDAGENAFGGVDCAFLNAGTLEPYGPMENVPIEVFDRMIRVNVRGTFIGVQQAQARLRGGGACVVTGSAASVTGFAEAIAYSTAKHALAGMVKSAAAGFARRNLRINLIGPGLVLTPMNGLEQDDLLTPPEALPNPEYRGGLSGQQVAEVALFLLSPRACGLNGQVQLVDAGLLSTFPPME